MLSVGCDKDDDDDKDEDHYKLSGAANGAAERPTPVTTNGTGTITGTYHLEDNMIEYTITWKDITGPPSAMHFHGPADVSTAAGVAVGITVPAGAGTSGTVSGSATLTDAQEADLMAGKWYYNIHTAFKPGGEIRGQVAVTP